MATFPDAGPTQLGAPGTLTLPVQAWAPPEPVMVLPAVFPDRFEVLIDQDEGGARLVAAIELVSPANKDRAAHRHAFAIKAASYLCQGISLVIIDIVTSRRANLHQELLRLLGAGTIADSAPADPHYAVAYRPVIREQKEQIEVWPRALAIGQSLPVMPLALSAATVLPLDLEATYDAACRRRRLA